MITHEALVEWLHFCNYFNALSVHSSLSLFFPSFLQSHANFSLLHQAWVFRNAEEIGLRLITPTLHSSSFKDSVRCLFLSFILLSSAFLLGASSILLVGSEEEQELQKLPLLNFDNFIKVWQLFSVQIGFGSHPF